MQMTKSKRLRICLKEIIKPILDNAFYNQATDIAEFPYLTYEYAMRYSERKGIGILEVNIWDLNQSSENVEEIADNLESVLHELIYTDEHMILKFYTNTRLAIEDENKEMKRRRVTFEMQYYVGKE